MHGFRDDDEHGVAGRMRLMTGDVEVADAEREVDRVQIFERGWEIRKMNGEEKKSEHDDQRGTRRTRRG